MKKIFWIIIVLVLTTLLCQENDEAANEHRDKTKFCKTKCKGQFRCYIECMKTNEDVNSWEPSNDPCMDKCLKAGHPFTYCLRKCHH